MGIQIFGTKKCNKTAKAVRFFKERNIPVHIVDLAEKGISKGELTKVIQSAGVEGLIDETSKEFLKRGMGYMDFDPFEEILETPLILNTPVIRRGNKAVFGENQTEWKKMAAEEKK